MRTLLKAILVSAAGAALMPAPAQAQTDYPNRVVKIVNPYVAGGTTDLLARGLAMGLSSRLGQQFIVENKPGAGGALGTAGIARANPDGYELLFAPALVLSVHPQVRDTGYKPDSLAPICQTFENAMGLVVAPDSPIKNVKDLVAAAQAAPRPIELWASGTFDHPASCDGGIPAERQDRHQGHSVPRRRRRDHRCHRRAHRSRRHRAGHRGRPAHPHHRHFRRDAAFVVSGCPDRQGARLRREPDQFRRAAGAGRHARSGSGEAGHRRAKARPRTKPMRRPRNARRSRTITTPMPRSSNSGCSATPSARRAC